MRQVTHFFLSLSFSRSATVRSWNLVQQSAIIRRQAVWGWMSSDWLPATVCNHLVDERNGTRSTTDKGNLNFNSCGFVHSLNDFLLLITSKDFTRWQRNDVNAAVYTNQTRQWEELGLSSDKRACSEWSQRDDIKNERFLWVKSEFFYTIFISLFTSHAVVQKVSCFPFQFR